MERFRLREGVAAADLRARHQGAVGDRPKEKHKGQVIHTVGWPLPADTYGGSWLYMFGENLVSIGFVVGLDYPNPWLSPFDEFQRFKTHPAVRPMLEGGRRIAYGARALNEGGFQAIPKLVFPGGALIGDSAGFLNVPKIKGTHTAMKSGMVAAEAASRRCLAAPSAPVLAAYPEAAAASWVWEELYRAATSARPSTRPGPASPTRRSTPTCCAARRPGPSPTTRTTRPCARPTHIRGSSTRGPTASSPSTGCPRCSCPTPTTRRTSRRTSSCATRAWPAVNCRSMAARSRYCPAGVYESVKPATAARLQINAQNCVHCKTCDIKDPTQNIDWVTPEGGGGPNYIGGM